MSIQVVFAALAVSASIPLLWWSLASDRRTPAEIIGEVDFAGAGMTDARQILLREGAGRRVLLPAVKGLGMKLVSMTPVGWTRALQRQVLLAGHHADSYVLERLLLAKFGLGALGVFVGLAAKLGLADVQRVVLGVVLGAVLFFLPDLGVMSRARARQERILLELPDTIDQVTMSVEAGLGFEAALTRAVEAGDGPLAAEFRRTLREIQLGIPREQALRRLTERTDVGDLDSFLLAVIQSEHYGIPIARVLRVQSDELRDKRRQRAEERALKIPVLLIFPLAFCVFPAMFIVLLGPAVIRIIRDVSASL